MVEIFQNRNYNHLQHYNITDGDWLSTANNENPCDDFSFTEQMNHPERYVFGKIR